MGKEFTDDVNIDVWYKDKKYGENEFLQKDGAR